METKEVRDLVKCNTFSDFWVSWVNKKLTVGTGSIVDVDALLSADNIDVAFTSVAVGTYDGTVGLWRFPIGTWNEPSKNQILHFIICMGLSSLLHTINNMAISYVLFVFIISATTTSTTTVTTPSTPTTPTTPNTPTSSLTSTVTTKPCKLIH